MYTQHKQFGIINFYKWDSKESQLVLDHGMCLFQK